MKGFSLIAALVVAFFLITSGCSHNPPKPSSKLPNFAESSRILADYQPWFGSPGHINVGYSTLDPNVVRKQIQRAKEMGIYAFAVDWYGDRRPFEDKSYALLQQLSRENNFHVCLMYDETQEDNGQATEEAIEALDKAYRSYIGPTAADREAYVTYEGRPVIFIFPKRGNTDWERVRNAVNLWERPPLLVYKDEPPARYAKVFDGYYAWVHPGREWKPDGSDWGKEYLEGFYRKMEERSGKIVVGAIWPGFNDSRASWGLDRHMSRRCGETFEDTLKIFHHYSDPDRPMPFLLIATWNDYEEGTEIETGVSNCKKQNQLARERPAP